jgi:hypothetical protein
MTDSEEYRQGYEAGLKSGKRTRLLLHQRIRELELEWNRISKEKADMFRQILKMEKEGKAVVRENVRAALEKTND